MASGSRGQDLCDEEEVAENTPNVVTSNFSIKTHPVEVLLAIVGYSPNKSQNIVLMGGEINSIVEFQPKTKQKIQVPHTHLYLLD